MSDTPSRKELLRSIFDNMSVMKRSIHSQMQTSGWTAPISAGQFELLLTIQQLQPVSFKVLAKQLHLTPGAVSQLAETLEQRDLLERSSNAEDRRIQCLSISNAGKSLIRQVEEQRHHIIETVMEQLTDAELKTWDTIQKKVIEHYQSQSNQHK